MPCVCFEVLQKSTLQLFSYLAPTLDNITESNEYTLTHMLLFSPAKASGARRRQSGLMKYSSLEFKDSTVGPVKGMPRDGDVSRSFMTLE